MKKQNFDLGWEYTEATGFRAMFDPSIWQPVTLPHDAMIGKPRSAEQPIRQPAAAISPAASPTTARSSLSPRSGAGRACSSSLKACT